MKTRVYLPLLLATLFAAITAPAATLVWTNSAGGNWSGAAAGTLSLIGSTKLTLICQQTNQST
jgi:hypothetical protein